MGYAPIAKVKAIAEVIDPGDASEAGDAFLWAG